MILKWTFDDNRPFSIVEKDFDIDILASQTKPISGIFMTEFQECCFLVVQYSSKVYFETFLNSLQKIICRPLAAFYVNKGVKNGNLTKLNDLIQKCDTKSYTVGVVTFLGPDKLEDDSQMSSVKAGQFNISMLKDFAIEYNITVHDDLIARYSRLRNPSVRGTVGSKKCNCGFGVPADVHEYHRVNASIFYMSAQSSTWAKTCSSEAQAHVHAHLANTPISKVFSEWFVNYSPFKNRNVNEFFIEEHQDQLNMNFLPFSSNPSMVRRSQPTKMACMAIHEVIKLFCSAEEQWKHRTLVISGPSDSGKSTFCSVLLSILGRLDSCAISLEHKDMFELGHTYKKHCVLIEDALIDSWEKMLTNLRNAFDGQIMIFNPKYGKTRSGIFGRSMVTTNMSYEEVLAGVGNRRSEEIATTGLRRFPTWIYLRQPPPFPDSKKYSLNKADCEYLFHLNIQSMVKLLVNETDHDRVFITVDGAQAFFEKMAIFAQNDLISAFDIQTTGHAICRVSHSATPLPCAVL